MKDARTSPSTTTNGSAPGNGGGRDGFGTDFTEMIVNATGPNASPRLRQVIGGLIRALHGFCRDNEVSTEEWLTALDFINEAGRMSDSKRNESQLLCGVLGIETLLDRMVTGEPAAASTNATASNLLGPFWQNDSPILENGSSIVLDGSDKGCRVHMHGQVLDSNSTKPIVGALVDIWHSNGEGIYAQQDPNQPHFNLRGKFLTDQDGRYDFYCSRPSYYSIPADGPAGKLIRALDRHPMRPAHIHAIVSADGCAPITTELFDRESDYLYDDSMFAVKESLIVDFVPVKGDEKADYDLKFDFHLQQEGCGKL